VGSNCGPKYLQALGFNEHGYPGQACWYRVLGDVDVELVEVVIRIWVQAVLGIVNETHSGLSIDGKTLRVSQKMGACESHLLSAVVHELAVVLAQLPISDKTNEIGMMQDFLLTLTLQGRIVTTDALLTQAAIAQTIVQQGGDYILPVKDNQPSLRARLETWFRWATPEHIAHSVSKGHGRITRYDLETATRPCAWFDWPGLQQIFKLTRTTLDPRTGQFTRSTVYGITSLSLKRASLPTSLLLSVSTGRLKITFIGCAMSFSMKTILNCVRVIFIISWLSCVISSFPCCAFPLALPSHLLYVSSLLVPPRLLPLATPFGE